jgi:hypothetical protein
VLERRAYLAGEVGGPGRVLAGKIRPAFEHGATNPHPHTPPFEHLDPGAQAPLFAGSPGSDHADDISRTEAGRLADRRTAQLRAEIPAGVPRVKPHLANAQGPV